MSTIEEEKAKAAAEVKELADLMTGLGMEAVKGDVESRYRVLACYAAAVVIARDLKKVILNAGDGALLAEMDSLAERASLFEGMKPEAEA